MTWSHYRRLISVKNEQARLWYMNEAADGVWSTRQMDRQISTLYYERLLAGSLTSTGTNLDPEDDLEIDDTPRTTLWGR